MYLTPKFDGAVVYGVSGHAGAPGAPIQALTATGQIMEYAPNENVALYELDFICTTSVSATSAPVISVYSRPVAGVSGSDVLLGTLTIPTGCVAGNLVYRKVSENSFLIPIRSSVVFSVTTAASSAGKGIVSFKCSQDPEDAKNIVSGIAVTG